ncbi:transcription termination factor MTERF5, chloroplastic-like [Andrographis paniculata]|uniref:transcription termination factor MTERF5, chloroplastic-like n=1 Tax=Andrographis paniculata TaxID=175694 RepID=UPI0021E958BA|nr:transcription termination factor MTERF5, chloroplastic-like [Andrographis paniculata]
MRLSCGSSFNMISILRRNITCCCLSADYAAPHGISRSFCLRIFSTSNERDVITSAAIYDLLRNKHQFSAKVAAKAASVLDRVKVKHPENCEATLSFLRESGFSNTQLEKMVNSVPTVLFGSLEGSIKPKIKVFQNIGFRSEDIPIIISSNPILLRLNLSNRVIPLLSMAKGLLGNDEAFSRFCRRSGWALSRDLEKTILPNIELLKSYGVPMERIIKFMCTFPRTLMYNPENFMKSVEKAEEMGADRKSHMFIYSVRAVSQMSCKTLELKLQALRQFGFSESDIRATFQKSPYVFSSSVDRLKKTKDFLLATGKYDMSSIVKNPMALLFSIERRYNPRCKTLQLLESRNLIEKWPSLSGLFLMSDKAFFDKFVGPYLSELNNVYPTESSMGGIYEKTKVT